LLTQIICTKNCRNIIKKKNPRSYRVCPTSKRKEKEQRNPNLCQISQDQELKKETKKAPA